MSHFVSRDASDLETVADDLNNPQVNDVGPGHPINLTTKQCQEVNLWIDQVQSTLDQLVSHNLENSASISNIDQLEQLREQTEVLANALHETAIGRWLSRIGYSLERRLDLWRAVHVCLNSSNPTPPHHNTEHAPTNSKTAGNDRKQVASEWRRSRLAQILDVK